MRVAAFQGECHPGDPDQNLTVTLSALQAAKEKTVDVLCMPETFLQGYFPNEAEARRNSISLDSTAFAKLVEATKGYPSTLLVGLNEKRGDKLFNTVVVVRDGLYLGCYSKAYPIFDYFAPGRDFDVFMCNDVRFGVIICADSGYIEPTRLLALKGAQVIFAPHYNFIRVDQMKAHADLVRRHFICRAVENDVYLVRSNVVWKREAPGFDYEGFGIGDSFVMDRTGKAVAEAGWFSSTLLVADIPDALLRQRATKIGTPELGEAVAEEMKQARAHAQGGKSA